MSAAESAFSRLSFQFKTAKSFEDRCAEVGRIKKKYTDRIPVVCEYFAFSKKDETKLDKNKFLVPGSMTLSSFMLLLRKRLALGHEKALFLFTQSGLVQATMSMAMLYQEAQDADGFLYVAVRPENVYGM